MLHHYKPIPGYEGYFVTKTGIIRNNKKRLKAAVHRDGHLYHVVLVNGVSRMLFVHKAVMLAHGPINDEGLPLIRHLDGNPKNNRLANLAWGNHKENAKDREFHRKAGRKRRMPTE